MKERPLDARELTRRLLRRPGEADRQGRSRGRRRDENRRPYGSQAGTIGAALAIAGGGGGGGGGGPPKGGTLGSTGVWTSQYGVYPLWLDDFDDDATDGWTFPQGIWSEAGGLLTMTSGAGLSGFRGVATFDATAGVADIEVFTTLGGLSTSAVAVGARMTSSANPLGYFTVYQGGQLRLGRGDGLGGYTTLDSIAATIAAGQEIGVRCRGTRIQATLDGATVLTATDATRTDGYCGLAVAINSARSFDQWGTR